VVHLGEVPDMIRLLHAVDMVIFPVKSLYGKMDLPLVLLEAMAARKPIIVSDLPPLTELMTEEPGIVTPAGDDAALIRAVSELIQDKPTREKMGSRGFNAVEKYFTAESMADAYEKFYDSVLGEK